MYAKQAATLIQQVKAASFENEVKVGLNELIQQRLSVIQPAQCTTSAAIKREMTAIQSLLREKYLSSKTIEERAKKSKSETDMLLGVLKELRHQSRYDNTPEVKQLIDDKQAEYTAALNKTNSLPQGRQALVDAERKYQAYQATKQTLLDRYKQLKTQFESQKWVEDNLKKKEQWRKVYELYVADHDIEGFDNFDEMIANYKMHAICRLPDDLHYQVKNSFEYGQIDFISRTYDSTVEVEQDEDGNIQLVNTLVDRLNPRYQI